MLSYALITPAHNEQDHLPKLIGSVMAQTHKPIRWVIVNDGSSDATEELARVAPSRASFASVITVNRNGERSFSNKANAFRAGLEVIQTEGAKYDLIGNL